MTLHNIADMQETGAKISREYKTLPPVFIRKLVNKLPNIQAVGDAIGVTGTTIGSYLKNNEATTAMEMAAQFVYERDYPEGGGMPKTKPVSCIIQAELHQVKMVKDLIETVGGKVTFLEL